MLEVGSLAPPFTLPGAGGKEVALEALRGRQVVLFFYPKDDTSGCTAEARDFNALGAEFEASDTAVIGVSPDSPKSHDKFAGKYGLEFPLGSDETKTTLQAYGVWVQKSMYGRKYMGVERTTFLIARDGTISQVWNNVKVPGHAAEVLAAAKALAAG